MMLDIRSDTPSIERVCIILTSRNSSAKIYQEMSWQPQWISMTLYGNGIADWDT